MKQTVPTLYWPTEETDIKPVTHTTLQFVLRAKKARIAHCQKTGGNRAI